jgi:hypothetical protein
MIDAEPRDPFSLTADTRLYVARDATEQALERLRVAVESGGQAITLVRDRRRDRHHRLRWLARRELRLRCPVDSRLENGYPS